MAIGMILCVCYLAFSKGNTDFSQVLTRESSAAWSKVPVEVRVLPSYRAGEVGALSSWMIAMKRYGSQVFFNYLIHFNWRLKFLRKTLLGLKAS